MQEKVINLNKYKVCVYAISKNEEKYAREWAECMSEADTITVLDTGSTDNTVSELKKAGVDVFEEKITPWRFDTARNRSLELVPQDADICVCVDLDEKFESGWRDKLEKAWQSDTKRARYRYTWNFNPDGSEGYVFWLDKIHSRNDFYWEHPVHEVLCYKGATPCNTVLAEGIQLNHHADPAKSREQYLPLLELAVAEKPGDDRNMHYLGREYMFKGEWKKSIETLKKHLEMPSAVWSDERCASMRYIARSYKELQENEKAKEWLYKAIGEAPYLREPYTEMANLLYGENDWYGVIYFCEAALKIKERPKSYICEAEAWGSLPYDLASIGYYYTGDYKKALKAVSAAAELSPSDSRIAANKSIIESSAEL